MSIRPWPPRDIPEGPFSQHGAQTTPFHAQHLTVKFGRAHKVTLQAIFEGTYTPLDVREFVQLCYVLALPLIRSRINRGKLNLAILGMKEVDIVYDCVADLFRRDSTGSFVQVKSYFASHGIHPSISHEDDLFIALRRLVFGKVHNSLVRLYSESDPALGKILRNIQLELEKDGMITTVSRFGETCLTPRSVDAHPDLPPIPLEFLRRQFSLEVSVRDSIPRMIEKLGHVLSSQSEYQSVVPLVTFGLLVKEVYEVASGFPGAELSSVEHQAEGDDLAAIAEFVCGRLAAAARGTYLGKGKRTEREFEIYIEVVKTILLENFGAVPEDGASYYDHLKKKMPGLSKGVYARRHRAVLEYLAKKAKLQMKKELKTS